jgi:hypothetical protein
MVQKRKLALSLILASFLVFFMYSFASAQSVSFENKTVPFCADVYVNVSVETPVALGAFEVIFQVSGSYQTFDVTMAATLPQMTKVTQVDGNKVRLAGVRAQQTDVCLPAGTHVIGTVHMKAADACSGTITLSATTWATPFVHGTLFVECADPYNQVTPTVGTGTITLVNAAPDIVCPTVAPVPFGTTVVFDVTATDVDLANGCEQLTFTKVSGPGAITSAGHYTWATGGDDICLNEVVIRVTDGCGATDQCTVSICVTDLPPVAVEPPDLYTVMGVTVSGDIDATDPDGGPSALHFSLLSLEMAGGTPAGATSTFTLSPTTGEWSWGIPFDMDFAGTWTLCITVDDGAEICPPCNTTNSDTVCLTIDVAGFDVTLECESGPDGLGVLQNQAVEVSINLDGRSDFPIGGFDFLIAYDASALSAINAEPGELIDEGGFEYFTYRFGPFGNCDGGCPSGMLRIVGLRELNNGVINPNYPSAPGELAKINFFVSGDLNLECQVIPVSFYWLDCGDNTLSDVSGNFLFVGLNVFDYEGNLIDSAQSFGYTGPDDECFDTVYSSDEIFKNAPLGAVYFKNGCVRIICKDDIDDRGDVNLNGIANEVADAVVFTNYFIVGLNAFTINIAGQTAATEVNGDGVPLSVADLVYLIRVIIGDALPLPKLTPGEPVKFAVQGHDISLTSASSLGGALFVFDGEVTATLAGGASHMEIKSGYLDGQTRILVHPGYTTGGVVNAGAILHVEGEGQLVSIEAADANGTVVEVEKVVNLPTEFALGQNYPNPFNPATTIEMSLPVASDWTLTIYNINGQKVKDFAGHSEAGMHQVVWEANVASGMYFYKMTADGGRFTAYKKMVLLK